MCIALGNDVNAVNDPGVTALTRGPYRGVNIVAEYLVEQGAKLDVRDMNGWIPWAIATGSATLISTRPRSIQRRSWRTT